MKHLSEERIQQTEKLIREIMKESDACGLAACIIDNSGNTVYEQFFGSRRKDQDYRSVDIGIAAANICLCATTLGLSTCIVGWFDEKKLAALVGTTARIRLVISLGYAAEDDKLRAKKRKDITELVKII